MLAVEPFKGGSANLRVVPPVEEPFEDYRIPCPIVGGRRDWVKCEKAGEAQSSLVSIPVLPPPTILWRAPGSTALQLDLLVSSIPMDPEASPAISIILRGDPTSCRSAFHTITP